MNSYVFINHNVPSNNNNIITGFSIAFTFISFLWYRYQNCQSLYLNVNLNNIVQLIGNEFNNIDCLLKHKIIYHPAPTSCKTVCL